MSEGETIPVRHCQVLRERETITGRQRETRRKVSLEKLLDVQQYGTSFAESRQWMTVKQFQKEEKHECIKLKSSIDHSISLPRLQK